MLPENMKLTIVSPLRKKSGRKERRFAKNTKAMETTITERAAWAAAFIAIEYLLVLAAAIADMVSGIRKAKRKGQATRSRALRRTIDKLLRYYNLLAILTIVDIMQIAATLYLRAIEGYSLPTVPLFTLIGSIGIALIEVKSIMENGSDKEKSDIAELADLLDGIAKSDRLNQLINILKSLKK